MSRFHKICWALALFAIAMLILTIGVLNHTMLYFRDQAQANDPNDPCGAPTVFVKAETGQLPNNERVRR